MLPTIAWEDDAVVMVDQRKLPATEVYVRCTTANEVARAIKTMVIRGAPAIGVAAAMGVALGMGRSKATGTKQFAVEFQKLCDAMAATRPTAVNLFWAIERMKHALAEGVRAGESADQLKARLKAEALAIEAGDVESCRAIGRHGGVLVPDGARVLTHCNAGALATAGIGTAVGMIRAGWLAGKVKHVYPCETRPYLQGARLTLWELMEAGIPSTLITDNMAAHLMKTRKIDAVIVGSDRIAANADVCNKIGTYGLAIHAKHHGIPFFVVAPSTTVDFSTKNGDLIPIEERSIKEVVEIFGVKIAPKDAKAHHFGFDVTPHALVTAIVTEKGV
ncbi:MAG: S-methyl-5-thioribose-1-phosphate isomerase, partial [Vicinamibacterales bacterium]|nr:S-methyl-5-thioribose-1-phosphate isomerase [Vicinamibacterales bacterium]